MAYRLESLATGGAFFESPRWHDGRWWVSDFYTNEVAAITPAGKSETIAVVDAQPGGLGWSPDGSLLIVSRKDHLLLRIDNNGKKDVVADLSGYARGMLNDMVVDGAGRAWIGDIGFDVHAGEAVAPTTLKRVDPNGTISVAADNILCPNGSVVTPDGVLIVGESFAGRFISFDIAPDGSLGPRQIWAVIPGTTPPNGDRSTATPDGCCLDAEGQIWVAEASTQRCLRIEKGGRVTDEIAAPDGRNIFACMLGGADGRTLVLCCAPDSSAANRSVAREAELLTTVVSVPGAGFP
jgi:sugar lactone lactonase YvrE